MKLSKILVLMAALTLAFGTTSCFKKMKNAKNDIEQGTGALKSLKNMAKEAKDAQKDMQAMQNVEPITNDDFKAWMPESLNGLPRSGFKLGTAAQVNISSAELEFSEEGNDHRVEVEVMDGAGPLGGSILIMFKMMLAIEMEEESSNGYKKTVKHKGQKYHIDHNSSSNRTEISTLHDDRFGVKVVGRNMSVDELWDYVDDLQLNKLN